MKELNIERGRVKLSLKTIEIGEDLCVIVSGGEKPHIGCVTLSVPRKSLEDETQISSTTSVLNMIGHKDDEVARYVGHELSSKLNKNVVITCGIHIDNITKEEIHGTIELVKELTSKLIRCFSKDENNEQ